MPKTSKSAIYRRYGEAERQGKGGSKRLPTEPGTRRTADGKVARLLRCVDFEELSRCKYGSSPCSKYFNIDNLFLFFVIFIISEILFLIVFKNIIIIYRTSVKFGCSFLSV